MNLLRRYILEEFERRKRRNTRYSLRSFARSIGYDPSTLSAIIRGKRQITVKSAQRLLGGLKDISPIKRRELLASIIAETEAVPPDVRALSDVELESIGTWQHFAVLSLLDLNLFEATESAISRRLRISMTKTQRVLKDLGKLRLICKEGNRWIRSATSTFTSDQIPSPIVRELHRQFLVLALVSLAQDSVDERDITGITFTADAKKIPIAKQMIQEFRRSLASFLYDGERNSVFRLSVQLFPLAKPE